ncbi:MAG: AAA family ATPase [Clostridiales bacterium]|nr:AAA family ATPase [Clostridiales bacterium]
MRRSFNVTGVCNPDKNYMVDISSRIERIKNEYVIPGKYFTINRARQYGKTTTLYMLEENLRPAFLVLSLSFEAADEYFVSAYSLAVGMMMDIADCLRKEDVNKEIIREWEQPISSLFPMRELGKKITRLCDSCKKQVVLMIDEVDKSSDNQIFLSFLGLLRSKYMNRLKGTDTTFWSVILSGVYDIKNLKQKLHPGEESKYNSPWNIAADFSLDMSFSPDEIASMLQEYENEWDTGMDVKKTGQLLYDYTSGYPFLVSRLCQLLAEGITDCTSKKEKNTHWSTDAFQNAVRNILKCPNTLFDDMSKKLSEYPNLRDMIYSILFQGRKYSYEAENERIRIGEMFGFLKEKEGIVSISNRIFEMKLYNLFLSEEETDSKIFTAAETEKNYFIRGGYLQMELVLEKFCEYFEEIYGDTDDQFIEENGRRIFLIFLKPIINGNGNYYIESRTRNMKRTDVIIDYRGIQSVLEMKIWHGAEYNRRGEQQLLEYMDYYHLEKGYMLSFNFNKNKQTGIRHVQLGERFLVEAIV